MNQHHNQTVLQLLRPGDRVKFDRKVYTHWGIYVGNGDIIHFAGEDNDGIDGFQPQDLLAFSSGGGRPDKAEVMLQKFLKVVGQDKAYRDNSRDRDWSVLTPRQIVQRAYNCLGKRGYDLVRLNCEHFANWCRYNVNKSDQVDNVMTGAAVAAAGLLTVGLIHGVVKWFGSGSEEKEEEEKKQRGQRSYQYN